MLSLLKKFFKTGVIATLLLGGVGIAALTVAGPSRTKAVMHKVHSEVLSTIDGAIDDPVALRSQLEEMESEYPKRIAQVRADLASLSGEISQLEREQSIAERVVELARGDLAAMEEQIAQASATVESSGLRNAGGDRSWMLHRATNRAQQIEGTRIAYAARALDADHDLRFMHQQHGRLQDLLMQLENEREQFRGQIQALSRQVEAIARNERLIGLLEKRNNTLEECSRYEAVSLEQITGRLASIRTRQEAELDMLSMPQQEDSYEDLARLQLAAEKIDPAPAARVMVPYDSDN